METGAHVVAEYEDRVAVFQEMLSRQGVTLAAVETGLRPVTQENFEEEIERSANVGRFLRANRAEILVLKPPPWPPVETGGQSAESWKLAVETISQIGRRTIDLDVRTCISPDAGTVAQSKREVERLLEQTDPEFVRLCVDLGFLGWAGISAPHFVKKYAARIDYVHVRDLRKPRRFKSGPEAPKGAQFGKGVLKLASLTKLLESMDYSGWVTVVCPAGEPNPVPACRAAGELVRRALGLA
jgi:inosose dehydratase